MKQYWRRLSLSLLALPLLILALPAAATAHVLKQDNGISAVLHIPPDDNPQAGQSTELDLSFGDDANAFSLTDCHCLVTIESDSSKIIYRAVPQPALKGATLDSIAHVTFPTVGVYHLTVSGSATHGNFKPFSLDFLVRVAGAVGGTATMTSRKGDEIIIISLGSLAILGLFAYTNMRAGGRYVTEQSP
jgi:hypothetical protein